MVPEARRFSVNAEIESEPSSRYNAKDFDRKDFQRQFDKTRPPQNELFDKKLKVYGLSNGQFLVNHYWIPNSVILFPTRFYMWNVADASEIKPHTLEIMNFVKPRPDYLIIGTGEKNVTLDFSFYEHFRRMGITVDTCPSFEACSTFNMCNEDEYNVAAALLRPQFLEDPNTLMEPKDAPDSNEPKEKHTRMGIISKMIKLEGLLLTGGVAFTAYQYPELRKDPGQLVRAMIRGMRCAQAGALMGYDYLTAKEINGEVHARAAQRMYNCFAKNAGPYIKLGQMVSQFHQLLPQEYCDAFEPMCMQAPRTPFNDVKQIVESELGRPLEDVFEYFEETPLASASLAQVHRARLRGTGQTVAVKVQHKWIKEQVPGDMRLVQFASDVAERLFPSFKYGWLPHEFKMRLPLELDFRLEAKNADTCREIFKDNPNIYVPTIYHDLTRERVLVMSFETGIPVTQVKAMYNQGVDLKRLSRLISQAFTYMIFEKGFVHSDPHPGNMFVRNKKMPDGSEDLELVILDHGIYTHLPEDTRLSYTKLWRGILSQDEPMIRDASKELGADFYELFTAIIVNRTYDDVMNKDNQIKTKTRLGQAKTPEEMEQVKKYALYYHNDIVEILDMIKRELLLVLKTNNYLRAIDRRLGNPVNSFNTINEVTWNVFKKEMKGSLSSWVYYKEAFRYYWLKFMLTMYWLKISFMRAFGVKASEEELEDFDQEIGTA